MRDVVTLGEKLGVPATIAVSYAAWQWQAPFPGPMVRYAAAQGVTPQITWEPWDPREGVTQPGYRLSELHRHDAYVDAVAEGLVQAGRPVSLRFCHEMNGAWYPWSVGVNNNTTQDYVRAFRRTRARIDAAGSNRASWVWCPNLMLGDQRNLLRSLYPGDDSVDVIGLDGYDSTGKRTPEELFGPTVDLLRELAPDKPLWINETGSAPGPNKATWIRDVIAYAKATDVAALIWFEIATEEGPDWRLLQNTSTKNAATTALELWQSEGEKQ